VTTAGARTVRFRFGPATKKRIELGRLVEAIQNGQVPPAALEAYREPRKTVVPRRKG
jgi:hypothetical protein